MLKKKVLIAGIILLAISALAYLLSKYAYYMGGTVMDGPGEFYQRWYRIYSFFVTSSKVFLIAGIAVLAVCLILYFKKKS